MNKIYRLIESFFIILGLMSFFGTLYVLSEIGVAPKGVITLIKYSIWLILISLNCIFGKSIMSTVSRNISLYLLTALTFLSFLWSKFPDFTLSNATEVIMMTLFGLYFATRFSLKEQVKLVACTLLIAGVLSTIVALGFPLVGIDQEAHAGAWKGVYGQKNVLGSMMVLSSLTFFALPKENSALYRWFGFTFSLVLMLLSTSKTSLVVSFLLMLIIMFYKNFKWQGKISVILGNIFILILACVAVVVLTYWIELITGLGRDPSLTGRTFIWDVMIAKLMEQPLFGYGLNAFWAPNSPYAIEVGQAFRSTWIPPNGHNGLLDLSVDVGLVGLALFLISYFTTFVRSLKRAYASKNSEDIWPLGYLSFLAMNNLTESYLMHQHNPYWIFYTTVVITMSQTNQRNIKFPKRTSSHVI
ncbi:O-antigen ligase family protein [Plectonema radiosum NIES-515]|uniref:O-antigen ligase family protein n=1 Tax=Plectonema radiosum NIES-515 TaxID=2986073 RepID=A0ABT3B582_9CYAN|nr:O-antigen ligase family protein [Plectonema radiosum]MCV3216499.1 O-antigen ligase family protein [Plectonema radiosum NIES-515]